MFTGTIGPRGTLALKAYRAPRMLDERGNPLWLKLLAGALPHFGLPTVVNAWRLRQAPRALWSFARVALQRLVGFRPSIGALYLRVRQADGTILDYGVAGLDIVTDAGATWIVDNLRNAVATIANMKFHGIGTGTTAAAVGDTALQTEITTAYNPDNTRATGSQTNNGAKVYHTVGTNTVDASVAATEWGLFTQAATGGGTMLDRIVFTVVNLANGDSLQSTFDFTVNSGG